MSLSVLTMPASTGSAAQARVHRITAGAARRVPIAVRRDSAKPRDAMLRSPGIMTNARRAPASILARVARPAQARDGSRRVRKDPIVLAWRAARLDKLHSLLVQIGDWKHARTLNRRGRARRGRSTVRARGHNDRPRPASR